MPWVKAESGHPGGTQTLSKCMGMDWESQNLPGVESGERCRGQQKRLRVCLQWTKTKENVGLLLNGAGTLEKLEALSATFILLTLALKNSETRGTGWSEEDMLSVEEDHVRAHKQTGRTRVPGA